MEKILEKQDNIWGLVHTFKWMEIVEDKLLFLHLF